MLVLWCALPVVCHDVLCCVFSVLWCALPAVMWLVAPARGHTTKAVRAGLAPGAGFTVMLFDQGMKNHLVLFWGLNKRTIIYCIYLLLFLSLVLPPATNYQPANFCSLGSGSATSGCTSCYQVFPTISPPLPPSPSPSPQPLTKLSCSVCKDWPDKWPRGSTVSLKNYMLNKFVRWSVLQKIDEASTSHDNLLGDELFRCDASPLAKARD